jgi:hypothetical protein
VPHALPALVARRRPPAFATLGDVLGTKVPVLTANAPAAVPQEIVVYLGLHLGPGFRFRNGRHERRVRGRWEVWPVFRTDAAGLSEAARVIAADRGRPCVLVDGPDGQRVVQLRLAKQRTSPVEDRPQENVVRD